MARPKYQITKDDKYIARNYIRRRLRDTSDPFPSLKKHHEATRAFEKIDNQKLKSEDLNNWCQTWITNNQWTTMKNAIRASRKRQKDKTQIGTRHRHISLTYEAWYILTQISKRDHITLSDTIEKYLEPEYNKILDQLNAARKKRKRKPS